MGATIKITAKNRAALHAVIREFEYFARETLPTHVSNALLVVESFPQNIQNLPLRWLLANAVTGKLENLVMLLGEAAVLMDLAARDFDPTHQTAWPTNVANVKRMRDKLVAHRVENAIDSKKYTEWYKKQFGSFKVTFPFLLAAGQDLANISAALQQHPKFVVPKLQNNGPQPFQLESYQIADLLSALKRANIY